MALRGNIPRAVSFIVGVRVTDGVSGRTPIGTGFLVGVRTPPDPALARAFTLYLVTAAHVVRGEDETWIRLKRLGGPLEDVRISTWSYHDDDDIAVSVLDLDEEETPYDIAVLPIPDFLPSFAPHRHGERTVVNRPMLGDQVYFVGLFAPIQSMGERNIPLVRSGTLAALGQDDVPIRLPDGTLLRYTAHLIDCRSYRGFSGSPCFVQFPREPSAGGVGRSDEETELLGVISSHFDLRENAGLTGEIAEMGTVEVPIHTGVGVVMPAESIENLLNREDVVDDRRGREAGYPRA